MLDIITLLVKSNGILATFQELFWTLSIRYLSIPRKLKLS